MGNLSSFWQWNQRRGHPIAWTRQSAVQRLGTFKYSFDRVVVGLRNGVVLVVMASRAGHSDSQDTL